MHKRTNLALFPYILVLYEVSVYLSNDMYLPSMPTIAKDLFLSKAQIQNTLTMWFLGASCLQFILGPLSDRFGRRVVIMVGGVFFILSSAICAVAESYYLFLAARFVQGTTVGSVVVAGNAAIHELFDTKQAIKILAIMGAVTILAPAFGPLCGALLTQFASWRYIFWFLFILSLSTIIGLFVIMPESLQHKHPLHIGRISRHYMQILSNKNFMLPNIGYSCLIAIFFFWMFDAPFLMINVYGSSPLYYGLSQAAIFSCFFVGAWITKQCISKFPLVKIVRVSIACTLLGTILFVLVALYLDSIYLSVACMMIISTGSSILFGPVNRIAIEASSEPMGIRTAVFSTTIGLFGALAGWILTLFKVQTLISTAWMVVISTLIAAILLLMTKIPVLAAD